MAFFDKLKQQEAKNKVLAALPMEERIKMRPEGVRYCMVNNTGKILDVYDNKVIFIALCFQYNHWAMLNQRTINIIPKGLQLYC